MTSPFLRDRWLLAAGGAVGVLLALAAAGTFLASRGGDSAPAAPPAPLALASPSEPAATMQPALVTPSSAASEEAACGIGLAVSPATAQDGRFTPAAALSGRAPPDPSAFLAVAREAAAQGHARDAEAALMVACRLVSRASPSPSVALADVQGQLGQHYVVVASGAGSPADRAQLLERGLRLLRASVQGYQAVLGNGSPRTRAAAAQVAALEQRRATEVAAAPAFVPAAPGATAPDPALFPPAASVLGAAPAVAPRPACGSAGAPEWCGDADLRQLDEDLRRLAGQAAAVTRDPAGMQRRSQVALARQAQCQDKGCLERWYAQRRRELLEEF